MPVLGTSRAVTASLQVLHIEIKKYNSKTYKMAKNYQNIDILYIYINNYDKISHYDMKICHSALDRKIQL